MNFRFIWECKYCHKIFSCNRIEEDSCAEKKFMTNNNFCFCDPCINTDTSECRIKQVTNKKILVLFKLLGSFKYETKY